VTVRRRGAREMLVSHGGEKLGHNPGTPRANPTLFPVPTVDGQVEHPQLPHAPIERVTAPLGVRRHVTESAPRDTHAGGTRVVEPR